MGASHWTLGGKVKKDKMALALNATVSDTFCIPFRYKKMKNWRERARIFFVNNKFCVSLYSFIAFLPRKMKNCIIWSEGVKGFKGSILNWGTRECSMLVRGSSRGLRDVGGG